MPVQLVRPTVGSAEAAPRPLRVPYADTDVEAFAQNTVSVPAGAPMAFIRRRRYANASFRCSIFNAGPGMISVRWDGQNTVFGAPEAIMLPPGTGYAEAVTPRIVVAADGAGATISMTCEDSY